MRKHARRTPWLYATIAAELYSMYGLAEYLRVFVPLKDTAKGTLGYCADEVGSYVQ